MVRDFTILHNIHAGSKANPASYTMSTGGCFSWDKAACLIKHHAITTRGEVEEV
jgi:hypothetical protein